MSYYFCNTCNAITKRESDKKTIKSHCDEFNKSAVLVRIDNIGKLAKKLRRKYLKNQFELKSFSRVERMFLESAYEQGASVVLNGIIR